MTPAKVTPAKDLPIAVIGTGPVGLAAAAHLLEKGETPLVLEAGDTAAASVLAWGHVPLFSPWRYCVDEAAGRLLLRNGWTAPDPESHPTGRELAERYLLPLARTPELSSHVRTGARVVSVTRLGLDKMKNAGREEAPFALTVVREDGSEGTVLARAVIDASGTYGSPNPLGSSGVPAPGERGAKDRVLYRIPDVHGSERSRYAGRRVAVVGSGHSAFNALIELAELAREEAGTKPVWVVRKDDLSSVYGGEAADALPQRGALGSRVRGLVDSGAVRLESGFRIAGVETGCCGGDGCCGVSLVAEDGRRVAVDEIVATTGFRPDLAMLSELRLDLHPAVESPAALAEMIDPNFHSCGTVEPHGAVELAHPEKGFYIVGMKSYGRAPTFLMLTGYEQARSVACELAGDAEGARRVELALPETGVCSGDGCCAPPPGRRTLRVLSVLPVAAPIPLPVAVPAEGSCCESGAVGAGGCCS